MTNIQFLYILLSLLPAIIIAVELFLILPVSYRSRRIANDSKKAFAIIKSAAVSDHWKEKALPHYSLNIFVSSLYLFILITSMKSSNAIRTPFFLGMTISISLYASRLIKKGFAAIIVSIEILYFFDMSQ